MKRLFGLSRGVTGLLSAGAILGLVLSAAAGPARAASNAAAGPIKIGFSVSLTGDFSGDGKAILQGYRLWANHVNSHGGLLGRKIQLKFYDDASSQTQVATNYTKLITSDKVDLTFGPFSSLLTIPAARVAQRWGYAFPAPAGGGPSVFQQGFKNFFFVQPAPVKDNLLSFVRWILGLPRSERPTSAAYVTLDDPFATPEVQTAQAALQRAGVRTAYSTIIASEATDFQPEALRAARSKAQIVLVGSPGANLIIALVHTFIQQHYNPKALVATSGPDQGKQFSDAIGLANTEGILVPQGWWYGAKTFQNKIFISEYLRAYHGTVADISQDTPEAYSVGQVIQQAVSQIHSLNNAALINELHRGTFHTVQGPMRWNGLGQPQGQMFLVQWRNGKPIPVYPRGMAVRTPEYPKPPWH
jgi:branched-chain amino acid transport system substrate-binding protein